MLRRAALAITWLGWLLAAGSLFLPASTAVHRAGVPLGTPIVGWEALGTIGSLTIAPLIWVLVPELLWLPVVALGTVLLLAMGPVLSVAKDEAGILQAPLIFTPAALLLLPDSIQRSLCWGIGIWVLAFVVFATGGVARCMVAAMCSTTDAGSTKAPAWRSAPPR